MKVILSCCLSSVGCCYFIFVDGCCCCYYKIVWPSNCYSHFIGSDHNFVFFDTFVYFFSCYRRSQQSSVVRCVSASSCENTHNHIYLSLFFLGFFYISFSWSVYVLNNQLMVITVFRANLLFSIIVITDSFVLRFCCCFSFHLWIMEPWKFHPMEFTLDGSSNRSAVNHEISFLSPLMCSHIHSQSTRTKSFTNTRIEFQVVQYSFVIPTSSVLNYWVFIQWLFPTRHCINWREKKEIPFDQNKFSINYARNCHIVSKEEKKKSLLL